MKNILILIPLMILLAACNCDEDHPLVGGDELELPDVFVVTNVSYTTVLWDNEPFEGIQVLFNRNVNPDLVIDSLSFSLEGENIYYYRYFIVDENWIFIPCGDFFCLSGEGCNPLIRLSGAAGAGIRSLDGELLDGDRDGMPGGDFVQEISVTGCPAPHFGLSIFPDTDSIPVSANLNNPLVFEVDFDVEADSNTILLDTGNDNIRIIHQATNEPIPFEYEPAGFSGVRQMDLIVYRPDSYCNAGQACVFRVIIEESVHSTLGVQLDGDGDGSPGGDFIRDYTIVPSGGPLLQVKSPGEDTIWLDWQPFDDTVRLDFSFSLPVGPNNLIFSRDVRFYCSDGEEINHSEFQFNWQQGSEENCRLEFPYWVPNEFCSGIDTLNGQFVTILKVVISEQVQSTGGVQLDGDYDSAPGGNAVKYFILPEQ